MFLSLEEIKNLLLKMGFIEVLKKGFLKKNEFLSFWCEIHTQKLYFVRLNTLDTFKNEPDTALMVEIRNRYKKENEITAIYGYFTEDNIRSFLSSGKLSIEGVKEKPLIL
jgi:hypothetical protein